MHILVLNGSPAGENSITLCTVRFIEKRFPGCTMEILHAGQRIRSIEKDFAPVLDALGRAELILFCYPVYTFLAPAQLHRLIELIKASGADLSGKYAAQITTSKHFYDVTAHRFIRDNCDDMGLKYVGGLSADMDDLLTEKGRNEAEAFFRRVLWKMEQGLSEPPFYPPAGPREAPAEEEETAALAGTGGEPGRVVIVTALPKDRPSRLPAMISAFRAALPCSSSVVNLEEFPFAGGCLGCFHCAADGTCVYRDGFDTFLRGSIQSADAIVYAYTVQDHSMGSRFKLYDDRQFCNGHRTVTMGKPVAYLVEGSLRDEPNLIMVMEARAQVGGNELCGVACTETEAEQTARRLMYALEHPSTQPPNFYGVGGMKIFRDLIYQMRGLMREDHRFYWKHGFYDFPQKRRGRILGMYAAGAMMRSEWLRRRVGSRMTEGMLLPYRRVLDRARPDEGAGKEDSRDNGTGKPV